MDTASLEHKMLALQTRTEESLRRLEGISHNTREELRADAARGTPALEEMSANIPGRMGWATEKRLKKNSTFLLLQLLLSLALLLPLKQLLSKLNLTLL